MEHYRYYLALSITNFHSIETLSKNICSNPKVSINPNLPSLAECDPKLISKRSTASLNSELFFYSTSRFIIAKKDSLPDYLPMSGSRRDRFISFPGALA